MKKVCIFDFDGTLVDTFTDAGIYYNKALEKFGFPTHELEQYKYLMGGTLEEVVTRIIDEPNRTEENITNVKKYYWDNYPNSKKENTKPYTGIKELLEKLQKEDIILAINTNKKQDMVEKLCKQLFNDIDFKFISGQSLKYPPKPDPTAVKDIINKCKVKEEDCIYIGDSKYDFVTAKNAGIDSILVKWGAYKDEYLDYACVKCVANEPMNIYQFMKYGK